VPRAPDHAAPAARTVLSFDYGLRRIGVAVGNTLTGTADALATVAASDGTPDWRAVDRLVADWRPAAMVAGGFLKAYQVDRFLAFTNPDLDPRGAGYQPIQARVSVGSGGLLGKGFMKGTQGQYKFLPVAHNDFIFSVLAEEHGFLGVLAALGLYLFVILRSIEAARMAKDRIGAYLVGGLICGFAFQVIYNITMSAGLAPVKGLTLPLMSYGGSSMIATLAGFGLILNVRMRRFTN